MTNPAARDLTLPEHPTTAAGLCEAAAEKGTGLGACDTPLDSHGVCPAAGNHRDTLDAGARAEAASHGTAAPAGEGAADGEGVELPSTRVIPPQETPTQQDMTIGVRVLRFAKRAGPGRVRAEMPCCARDDTTGYPPRLARGIELPAVPDTRITDAVCPACHWLWSFRVINEGRGRYLVVFDLLRMVAVAERTRSFPG